LLVELDNHFPTSIFNFQFRKIPNKVTCYKTDLVAKPTHRDSCLKGKPYEPGSLRWIFGIPIFSISKIHSLFIVSIKYKLNESRIPYQFATMSNKNTYLVSFGWSYSVHKIL